MNTQLLIALGLGCGAEPDPANEDPAGEQAAATPPIVERDKSEIRVAEVPQPRIHARHILIAWSGAAEVRNKQLDRTRGTARKIATQLLAQVERGADFGKLAQEHSDDGTRKRGGDLGVFTKGVMHPTFEQATLDLAVGQHSGVVETPFGFHIIERLPVVEVHVAHVLIQWDGVKRSTSTRTREDADLLAASAHAALTHGADFSDVARQYSDGPTGKRGGDLGWFQKGQMVPQFDVVAFSLSPGETSAVVESSHGLHIIHRLE